MKKAQKLDIVDDNLCVQLILSTSTPIRGESAIVCHLNIDSLKWEGFLPHYWDLDSN